MKDAVVGLTVAIACIIMLAVCFGIGQDLKAGRLCDAGVSEACK